MNRLLGVVLLLCAAVAARASVDDLPCVVCHPSRDRAAFDLLSETAGGPIRGESGQAFVCYSCHNGSVVDSRAVLTRGGQHPSGIVPSRALPKSFPLYAGGRLECGTCHSPHGAGAGAKRWLRGADDGSSLCTACHAGRREAREAHLGKRLTSANLKTVQSLGGRPDPGERIGCGTCHRPHGAPGPDLLLLPQAPGREELCLACHPTLSVGGSDRVLKGHSCAACHPSHGAADATTLGRTASSCGNCHQGRADRHIGMVLSGDLAQAVAALGGRADADGKIACATCHKIHGAAGARLLIAPYGPSTDTLCRTCHSRLSIKGVPSGQPGQPCGDCHQPHTKVPFLFPPEAKRTCQRCHASQVGAGPNHNAGSPTCSDCHSIHRPFLPEGRKEGLLRSPTQGGGLCLTCHPDLGEGHRSAMPTDEVDRGRLTARGIVLGAQGRVECLTCHATHGAKERHLLKMAPLLLCLYCHPKENPYGPQGARPGTHPVGVFLQRTQRRVIDSLGLVGALTGASSEALECSSCHNAHRSPAAPPVCRECHPSEAAGEGHGGVPGCGACHSIHGGGDPTLSCLGCHAAKKAGPHATLASLPPSLGCTSCHDSHGTAAKLLRKPPPGETCLGCHSEKRAVVGGSHDGLRTGRGSPCAPCHPAHGAARPEGIDPAGSTCAFCHPGDLRSLPNHGPTGIPAWKRVSRSLPLFDRQGSRNPFGFVTCPTCHDVHQGAGQRSLRLESRDPPKLCLACHAEKQTLLGSPHDPRSGGEGAACTVCHPPHSRGEDPPLWTLRAGAQGTWNDRKCSPCHGPPTSAPVRHAGPGSHPVNRLLPDEMKPAGLPLFDTTGGRAGRTIACSTCHDLHGREAAPGRRVRGFLRKEPATGDLCGACHVVQLSIVGTPHDVNGRWPTATGVCGPCHVAHGSESENALWGLRPGAGEYLANARCRSCHGQRGPVPSKFLLLQYHMKDAETILSPRASIYLQYPMALLDEWALKTDKEPVIPLYDKKGNPGPEGNLQCVSCHEPHQWSPLGGFVKPGFGAIGPNVATRFLRLRDTEPIARSVCVVCHPKDAAEKYLQYHEVWEELGSGFP